MELVNKKYVKMYKFDIFHEMVKAGATEETYDEDKVNFYQNVLHAVMNFESSRKHKTPIDEFYISVDDIDIKDAEVTRQTIVNALVYASMTNDFDMVEKIKPYLYKSKYIVSVGNEILDYILEHSMSADELIDGEKEKLIFNSNTNSLELGFIYDDGMKLERRNN